MRLFKLDEVNYETSRFVPRILAELSYIPRYAILKLNPANDVEFRTEHCPVMNPLTSIMNSLTSYFVTAIFTTRSRAVIGINIEDEDKKHTWMEDAESVSRIHESLGGKFQHIVEVYNKNSLSFVKESNYASMGMWRDSLRRIPPIGFFFVEVRGVGPCRGGAHTLHGYVRWSPI